mgnify:CR=1 FL=1
MCLFIFMVTLTRLYLLSYCLVVLLSFIDKAFLY